MYFSKKNEETSRTHRRFKHLEIKTAGTFIAFSIFNSQMKTNLHTLKKLRAASCYSVHTLKHLIPSCQIWTLVVPGSDPHLISWSDCHPSSSFSVGASQPLTIINMEENNNGGRGSTERRRRLVDVYEEASCLLLIFFMCVFSCLGDASLNTTSELSVNVNAVMLAAPHEERFYILTSVTKARHLIGRWKLVQLWFFSSMNVYIDSTFSQKFVTTSWIEIST